MVYTGADSYFAFGYETSFKSDSGSYDYLFGRNQRMNTNTIGNEAEVYYELGGREGAGIVTKRFTGTIGISAYLSGDSYSVFKIFFPDVSTTDNGDGSYTHTLSPSKELKTVTVAQTYDGATTFTRKYLGTVFNELTVDARVGDIANVGLRGNFADETSDTNAITMPTSSEEPLTFADAVVELPSGTTLTTIQNITVTIRNNSALYYTLGDRKAVGGYYGRYDYTASISLYLEDSTFIDYVKNGNKLTGMRIVFSNGETGADKREFALEFSDIIIPQTTVNVTDVGRVIEQSFNVSMKSATVKITNNLASI